jgi:hypothetical protein
MKFIAIIITSLLLISCSVMVRTPTIADYDNLNKIDENTSKDDVLILLGTPQGKGVHIYDGTQKELDFYYGFSGTMTATTAQNDSGTAFITYESDRVVDLNYFTSDASGPPRILNKQISIQALANILTLGGTSIRSVYEVLGPPDYEGKRIRFESDKNHKTAVWDASKLGSGGAIKEKWVLIGYDSNEVAQDLLWVSSDEEDIKEFGKISEEKIEGISRTSMAGFFPVLDPRSISAGTKLDVMQVDALMRTSPTNVKHFISVLGQPTALGIKSFDGDEPIIFSNWSFSSAEVLGREHNYIPAGATDEQIAEIHASGSYMIISVDQSRLMVGHDSNGNIKEIIWVRPID